MWQRFRERVERFSQQGRWKNSRIRRVLWGTLFFALLFFILADQMVPNRLDVAVGDPAPFDVRAPYAFENRVATEQRRLAAAAAIPPQMKIEPSILEQAEKDVEAAFQNIYAVREMPGEELDAKVEALAGQIKLGAAVPADTYANLITCEEELLEAARADGLRILRVAMEPGLEEKDLTRVKEQIDQEAEPFTLGVKEPWLKGFVKELVKSQVEVNIVEDVEQTEWLRQLAAQDEPPVMWKKGQLIVQAGQPITEEQYESLKDLGLIGEQSDYRALVGTGILSAAVVLAMGLYLYRYRPDILERDSKLLLLGLIGLLTLLLGVVTNLFTDQLGTASAYLMPIAFNAVLVTILLDDRLALLQSVMIALLTGLFAATDQLSHSLVAAVGSVVAVYSVAKVESRGDLYRAGLYVGLANAVTILALYLARSVSLLDWHVWRDVGVGALNGLLVAVLATGALPLFEILFGVVTPLKLLELSNPNHPLLKKLMVEAPGSYHHTILVANLCEAGAAAIGADQVLARVGAYYHDIGKIKRPAFFVENQFGGENPHDKLPPSLSAMIITSHVKEGIEMAREAGLPQEIIDFIPEHHGTTLVSYFYHMASKNGQSEYVLEEDFRYEGPKPRRKETAICMLADSCEASVRALRQRGPLTHEQIEQQVRRIFNDRLQQGQLDNCDLTLRELEVLVKVFVKVLSGVHHARIDYPGGTEGGPEGQQADAAGQAVAPAGDAGAAGPAGEPGPAAGAGATGGAGSGDAARDAGERKEGGEEA